MLNLKSKVIFSFLSLGALTFSQQLSAYQHGCQGLINTKWSGQVQNPTTGVNKKNVDVYITNATVKSKFDNVTVYQLTGIINGTTFAESTCDEERMSDGPVIRYVGFVAGDHSIDIYSHLAFQEQIELFGYVKDKSGARKYVEGMMTKL